MKLTDKQKQWLRDSYEEAKDEQKTASPDNKVSWTARREAAAMLLELFTV